MPTFDFDSPIDRRVEPGDKWGRYAGRDILPLWVADMDFAAPPPVLDALRRRVRRHEDGKNLFVDRLDAQLEARRTATATTRRRIVMLEMARTELGNYASEVELVAALEGTR